MFVCNEKRVNSSDIREINLKVHRSQIGYVGQEPVLFNMSIRDNITYGNEDTLFTIDDIIQAARKANIHDFIETLPQVILNSFFSLKIVHFMNC